MSRARRICAVLVVLAIPVVGLPGTPSVAFAASPRSEAPTGASRPHPKLSPALDDEADGRPSAQARSTSDDGGRVVVDVRGPDAQDLDKAIAGAGGTVRTVSRGSMLAWVPPRQLGPLSDDSRVSRVDVARRPKPVAVSEGVAQTGANAWQGLAIDGTGVRVAIVDLGFTGLSAQQSAGHLPSVTTKSFCTNGNDGNTNHGTAVTEIVHQMAPGAQLYLVCIEFDADLGPAEQYLAQQGVSVVNASFSDNVGGRGDGSGPMGDAIAAGRQAGQLWSVAAGNDGNRHFAFIAHDDDGDGAVEFVPGGPLDPSGPDPSELTSFTLPAGGFVDIAMKWDAWPVTNQEFGICLWNAGAPLGTFRGCQMSGQSTAPGQPVAEYLAGGLPAGQYVMEIRRQPGTTIVPRIDVYFEGDEQAVQRLDPAGSIGDPASAPAAMAVGAADVSSGVVEPFSGRGPTIDGRTKPDITGPDGVSNDLIDPFLGTSASAPHAAGAAALVKQALPSSTPAELQTFLSCRAVDAGAAGVDNTYGYGRLSMGALPDAAFNARSKPALIFGNTVFERSGLCSGGTDRFLSYGEPGDVVLLCDWDGNGTRTPGAFRNGMWFLRNAPGNGPADVPPFGYGDPGDVPVCGHWGGPGTAETPGVFRNGVFFLRDSNSTGVATRPPIGFGNPGDVPVVGDWDGNGTTTLGVFRNGVWFLRNSNTTGVADQPPIGYGDPGDLPVAGDWDGNGTTTLGVYRNGVWYLRNSLGGGVADLPPFVFGVPGLRPQAWR
jgi:hypothetical protein